MERADRIGEPVGHRCKICGQSLNNADDPLSVDCGGDCLGCMADWGDPDCIAAVEALRRFREV